MRRVLPILALVGLTLPVWLSTVSAEETAAKTKVLIITGDDVDVHPWKATTAADRKILLDSGKFDVEVSEDLKPLQSADTLNAYDVIVLNRYNRTAPLSEASKKNLLDFVRGGKGLFVQHLASASFPKWDDFGKLCGRYWVMGKSGHGPRAVFTAKITDQKHPITEGLKDFQVDDELYAKLQGTGPINVLIEADSDWSKKTEPLLFWLPYGEGRVVHSAFGHDAKAIATPEVTTITARGIEWAAKGKAAK
jgi:uncharacterized protein